MKKEDNMKCKVISRRYDIIDRSGQNGIDYIEVERDEQKNIYVYFFKSIIGNTDLEDKNNYEITGGVRVKNIRIEKAEQDLTRNGKCIKITVDRSGDFSTYLLEIKNVSSLLDPVFSTQEFSFKAGCYSRFDCRMKEICEREETEEPPVIDYMAKDFASFRRTLTDFISTRYPYWTERSEADLGMALVDMLSYTADRLSYFQDAVANEAYLETARKRVSVKRHAKLIDYRMDDGCNSKTFLHFEMSSNTPIPITLLEKYSGTGTKHETAPTLGSISPPGCVSVYYTNEKSPSGRITIEGNDAGSQDISEDFVINPDIGRYVHGEKEFSAVTKIIIPSGLAESDSLWVFGGMERIPRQTKVSTSESKNRIVFETEDVIPVLKDNNRINIHTWGNKNCCLPKGATSAYLKKDNAFLLPGFYLIFMEEKSPVTGDNVDADVDYRQAVKLTKVESDTDPIGNIQLLRVEWSEKDALKRDLWVSSIRKDGTEIRDITVALGNIVPASHGETVKEYFPINPIANVAEGFNTSEDASYQFDDGTWYEVNDKKLSFKLRKGPLTFLREGKENFTETRSSLEILVARNRLDMVDVECTKCEKWTERPSLITSTPFDKHFVVDVDENGIATVRFGDGQIGEAIPDKAFIRATYRIGNGSAGNIGYDSLDSLNDSISSYVKSVTNPLPAIGGVDPESIEHVKLLAPKAFHAEQKRAVTEEDYAKMVELHSEVSKARARFRWTGSWYAVFIAIDPKGKEEASKELKERVKEHITRYKMSCYDINIVDAVYVPLHIVIEICVKKDYFQSDVHKVLMEVLSNRTLPHSKRGFFHPDNFTFGQSVYLSKLFKVIEDVEGVEYASIDKFHRWGKAPGNEKENAVIEIQDFEIARLSNDPNFPEHGKLELIMVGGK